MVERRASYIPSSKKEQVPKSEKPKANYKREMYKPGSEKVREGKEAQEKQQLAKEFGFDNYAELQSANKLAEQIRESDQQDAEKLGQMKKELYGMLGVEDPKVVQERTENPPERKMARAGLRIEKNMAESPGQMNKDLSQAGELLEDLVEKREKGEAVSLDMRFSETLRNEIKAALKDMDPESWQRKNLEDAIARGNRGIKLRLVDTSDGGYRLRVDDPSHEDSKFIFKLPKDQVEQAMAAQQRFNRRISS